MTRRTSNPARPTTIIAAAIAGLILVSGCTSTGLRDAAAGPQGTSPEPTIAFDVDTLTDDEVLDTTDTPGSTPTEPGADAGTGEDEEPLVDLTPGDAPGVADDVAAMRDHGEWRQDPKVCQAAAAGPWDDEKYISYPVDLVLTGRLPGAPDPGLSSTPDEINEWTAAYEYHDPSTYEDPAAIRDAMIAGGFDHGAEAIWRNGSEEATISAVRYGDAAAAKAVLSAQLVDLCNRAESFAFTTEHNGMILSRRSGAMRVLSVLEDTVISVWACACISGRGDGMVVWDWYSEYRQLTEVPAPDTTNS